MLKERADNSKICRTFDAVGLSAFLNRPVF
jgi:hypothetical protein